MLPPFFYIKASGNKWRIIETKYGRFKIKSSNDEIFTVKGSIVNRAAEGSAQVGAGGGDGVCSVILYIYANIRKYKKKIIETYDGASTGDVSPDIVLFKAFVFEITGLVGFISNKTNINLIIK